MKTKTLLAALVLGLCLASAPFIGTGCMSQSQQRQSVNTLFTVGGTVNAGYRSYLDLIVAGKLATNSVPAVSAKYNLFQAAWTAAVVLVAGNSNAAPTQAVLDAAATFTTTVNAAKTGALP